MKRRHFRSLRLSTRIVERINLREIFKVEFSASMVSFEKLFNLRFFYFIPRKNQKWMQIMNNDDE